MTAEWYGLDGQPIDIDEAGRLLAAADDRIIAKTMITTEQGRIEVSTVFLVLNHAFDDGPPVLWETMTFGGPDDLAQRRYRSRQDAITGHAEAVSMCRAALDLTNVPIIAVEEYAPEKAEQ